MSLEDRVTALEADVTELRQRVTDAHMLAAHADRDVVEFRGELRAQTRLISALRETQLEHYSEHKTDAAELKADAAELKAGIRQIVTMLEGLSGS